MPQDEAETFQHYRLQRRDDGSLWKLGEGAIGVTYKAIDTNLDAPVALKVVNTLCTGNDAARQRFIREARAAAKLQHPNAGAVLHLGLEAQTCFYAMEFIEGESLGTYLKRDGPLSCQQALRVALQVSEALRAAARENLIHCDIKPDNLMLVRHDDDDQNLHIKVIDFGLARLLAQEEAANISQTGSAIAGTPCFMSPEQIDPLANQPDARTDFYSLGATLWCLLTGQPPFRGTQTAVFRQHLQSAPPAEELPAVVPAAARALLLRLLAKNREDRPANADELRREIKHCLRACEEVIPEAAPPAGAAQITVPQDETDVFEHYRILRRDDGKLWKLGAGAMGVTYKAFDNNLQSEVTLKVINAQFTANGMTRDRFINEARAAARLRHPNVASVYHLGHDAQTIFYAMEFIAGETVEDLVKRGGPLPWPAALDIALQVARALGAAYQQKIVHRDIKPSNIMLVQVDESRFVKVIDFGLAKIVEGSGSQLGKSFAGIVGTPLFASPEQCEEQPADIRSDIYGLGATLWFMLVGKAPFDGNLARVLDHQIHMPPPWEQLPAAVPESVRALLARMLAKDRANRPQTPAGLRREIETCLGTSGHRVPVAAPPITVPETAATPMAGLIAAETISDAPENLRLSAKSAAPQQATPG